jgi:hypothetical protein
MIKIIPLKWIGIQAVINFIVAKLNRACNQHSYDGCNKYQQQCITAVFQMIYIGTFMVSKIMPKNSAPTKWLRKNKIK